MALAAAEHNDVRGDIWTLVRGRVAGIIRPPRISELYFNQEEFGKANEIGRFDLVLREQ
jgi:hypothetical protein